METELYKTRSTRACFRAAYDLLCTNLTTVIKNTWLPMLVLSAVGCLYHAMPWKGIGHAADASQLTGLLAANAVMALALLIATAAAATWAGTCIVSLLNGLSRKGNAPRVARAITVHTGIALLATVTTTALAMVPFMRAASASAATADTTLMASGGIALGVSVVWGIVLLPLAYSTMKYLMEPSCRLACVVGSAYRQGWRRWGFLFGCALLCFIICTLFMVVVAAPENILLLARLADNTGALMGDTSGLPGHYGLLTYAVATACTFVWCYLMTWVAMVFHYAYGSIEAKTRNTTITTQP